MKSIKKKLGPIWRDYLPKRKPIGTINKNQPPFDETTYQEEIVIWLSTKYNIALNIIPNAILTMLRMDEWPGLF